MVIRPALYRKINTCFQQLQYSDLFQFLVGDLVALFTLRNVSKLSVSRGWSALMLPCPQWTQRVARIWLLIVQFQLSEFSLVFTKQILYFLSHTFHSSFDKMFLDTLNLFIFNFLLNLQPSSVEIFRCYRSSKFMLLHLLTVAMYSDACDGYGGLIFSALHVLREAPFQA